MVNCTKCEQPFEDGDITAIYNLNIEICGRVLPLEGAIRLYHCTIEALKDQLAGVDIPDNCMGKEPENLSYSIGVYYRGKIYPVSRMLAGGRSTEGLKMKLGKHGLKFTGEGLARLLSDIQGDDPGKYITPNENKI